VFYAREINRGVAINVSDSEQEIETEEKINFLFGVRIHLGETTCNYSEYMGLILA
jgi:hypothetical protein